MSGDKIIYKHKAQLEDCKRNQVVYEKIAKELHEAGYDRTYQQCRDKIKKLRGEYKKLKTKRRRQEKRISTGTISSLFMLFWDTSQQQSP